MRLPDKVALITGAGSGIGKACALRFAAEGAAVMCAGIHLEDERATAEEIRAAGGTARAVAVDVSREADILSGLYETFRHFGRLDIVVNNAGIGAAPWSRTIEVNLGGVYFGTLHGAERLAERGGSIVNISSILGLVGAGRLPDLPEMDPAAYVASKHGIIGLTRSFALSYGPRRVRVNAICPGYIETPMIEALVSNPPMREALVALHPIGRLGRAEEVANAALFLASDDASFVTGSVLAVDGGYTAQ